MVSGFNVASVSQMVRISVREDHNVPRRELDSISIPDIRVSEPLRD
jgi:hypothetical protein